jgi:alkyl hydroperoxide reductase subunit AhpF
VPKVTVRRKEAGPGNLPAIALGPRLSYCGVPSHNELPPFMDALALLNGRPPGVPKAIGSRLKDVHPPASVSLYVTPQCNFCPAVVRTLLPLPFAANGLRLRIIDGTLFNEAAHADKVRSVPTVILDSQYRWTGGVTPTQLCDAVESRDPATLDKAALQHLVTEGGAYDLAYMMCDSGRIFPAFLDLLLEDNFTVRLAAMVAMEELIAADPTVAMQAVAPLWQRYPQSPDPVKGDILYIFGELKSVESLPYLREVLTVEDNPEIREAAQEALEQIEGR